MTQSDLELLDRFRASGDARAFSEIVRRYASMVYSAGRRIVRDSEVAEDVAQETFFRLMRRPERVTQSLGGWLHRSATRLAVDARRSDRARLRRERLHSQVENDPSWTTISGELDEAIAALPDASRELLVRHFLQGESQEALAIDLSASPATVSRRMKVAIEELRMEMRRRGVDACPLAIGTICASCRWSIGSPGTFNFSGQNVDLVCRGQSDVRRLCPVCYEQCDASRLDRDSCAPGG